MFKKLRKVAVASIIGMATPWAAQATLTVYTTQNAFLLAVDSSEKDTFNNLSLSSFPSPLNGTAGVFGYQATATGGFFPAGSTADVWLSTVDAADSITFASFTGNVGAIGGYFFNSDRDGILQSGRSVTVVATDAGGSVSRSLANTTATTFLGFVSDGLLNSLVLTADNTGSGNNNIPFTWPTVNDLILAESPADNGGGDDGTIPEPATLALMGLGALGLGIGRRRD